MKLVTKTFIVCGQCGKEFGGPAAGDYEDWDGKLSDVTLEQYLLGEALGLFWVHIECGAHEVVLCSKKCVKDWANGEDCYADAK